MNSAIFERIGIFTSYLQNCGIENFESLKRLKKGKGKILTPSPSVTGFAPSMSIVSRATWELIHSVTEYFRNTLMIYLQVQIAAYLLLNFLSKLSCENYNLQKKSHVVEIDALCFVEEEVGNEPANIFTINIIFTGRNRIKWGSFKKKKQWKKRK